MTNRPPTPSLPARYGLAVAVTAVAAVVGGRLAGPATAAPFLLDLLFAVVVAARFGGVGPGLVATAGGLLVVVVVGPASFATAAPFGALAVGTALFVGTLPRPKPAPPPGALAVQARVLESMAEGVSLTDADGVIVYTNPAEERMFGVDPGELVGRPVSALVDGPPDEADRLLAAVAEQVAARGTWAGEWDCRRADGRRFVTHVRVSALDLGGVPYRVWVREDVTDRRRAEAERDRLLTRERVARAEAEARARALRASEERFQAFMDHSPAAAWVTTADGVIVYLSQTYRRLFRLPADDPVGRNAADLFPPELAAEYVTNIRAVADTGRAVETTENGMRADGSVGRFLVLKFPLASGDHRLVGGVAVDVTERERAEERLRDRELLLRTTGDNLPDGAVYQITVAADGRDRRFTHVTAGIERLVGVPPGDVLADPLALYGLIHPDDTPRVAGAEDAALRAGGPFDCEFRIHTRAGGLKWVHCRSAPRPFAGAAGGAVVWDGVLLDVTDRKRAEEEVQAARSQLQLVADTLPVYVTRCGRDGRYRWVNKQYATRFGLTPDDLVGRRIVDVLGVEAHATIVPYLERVLAGESLESEHEVPYRDLGRRWMHAIYAPTFDAAGVPDGWVGVVTDVTRRRELEDALRQSEGRLRFALSAGRLGSWRLDLQSGKVDGSALCHEHFGFPPGADLTFEGVHARVHPDDRERKRAAMDAAVGGRGDYACEYRVQLPGGEERWVASRARLTDDRTAVAGTTQDITDQKAAEVALRDADRRKDEFLATLAHELRNPLAPIRNAARVLRTKAAADPELRWVREVIDRQLGHMVRLVDDLLDVSRITRGKIDLRPERVDLATVIAAAVETSRPLMETGGHALAVELPPDPIVLDADPTRLSQVFANLLNNAAKYTPHGGRITVRVAGATATPGFSRDAESSERSAGRPAALSGVVAVPAPRSADSASRLNKNVVADFVDVQITDTGTGIPADQIGRVFEMFAQVEGARERAQGGLGIGLTLVRRLTEMHGGSVSAHSDGPGRGSTFTVRLPVARAEGRGTRDEGKKAEVAVPGFPHPSSLVPRPFKVLVADDNVDGAESLALMLEMQGYEVRTAHDGPSALAAAAADPPDVAVLDIGMPGMSGHEVARRLRADDRTRRAFLVALTGWGQDDDRRRSIEAGFDHHMVKPVDPETLMRLLAGRVDPD